MRLRRGTPAFRALCATLFAAGYSIFSLLYCAQALLPSFAQVFGLTPAQSSLSVSSATIAVAVSIIISGSLSDSFGRRALILGALFSAALLTLAAALAPNWSLLLATRALMGLALGGMPSVLIAYVSEEVEVESVGLATGIYISGSVFGGMSGRLIAGLLADFWNWRVALAVLGSVSLVGALYSAYALKPSTQFAPQSMTAQERLRRYLRPLQDEGLPWIFLAGALQMGGFITVYNYIGFRLLLPPYSLRPALVSLIFVLYLVGMASSTWAGSLAGRHGRRRLYWPAVALMFGGIALTLAKPLSLVAAGMGLMTFGFFGAHSLASSWVGLRGRECRAQAASLYLFGFYVGSSIAGWLGGYAWAAKGWPGVAAMVLGMQGVAFVIALRLARLAPLPRSPAGIDPLAAAN